MNLDSFPISIIYSTVSFLCISAVLFLFDSSISIITLNEPLHFCPFSRLLLKLFQFFFAVSFVSLQLLHFVSVCVCMCELIHILFMFWTAKRKFRGFFPCQRWHSFNQTTRTKEWWMKNCFSSEHLAIHFMSGALKSNTYIWVVLWVLLLYNK